MVYGRYLPTIGNQEGICMDTRNKIAYDYLHNSIVTHRIPPGTALVEQEISRFLNISRTPVREALEQLQSEGLVKHIPSRGTFVEEITIEDIEEILALRETLELLALKTAIDLIPEKEIDELESILLSLDLNQNSSYEDYYTSDRNLHSVIVRYGQNRRLSNFLNKLNSQIERLRRYSAMERVRFEESKKEHIEILQTLKEKDIDKATITLRNHIRNVKKCVLKACRNYQLS
jgi:DNA-binding GntR family transcriptional regulator